MVESVVFEGPEVTVLDLVRVGANLDYYTEERDLTQTQWHVLASHEVLRAPRADQTRGCPAQRGMWARELSPNSDGFRPARRRRRGARRHVPRVRSTAARLVEHQSGIDEQRMLGVPDPAAIGQDNLEELSSRFFAPDSDIEDCKDVLRRQSAGVSCTQRA